MTRRRAIWLIIAVVFIAAIVGAAREGGGGGGEGARGTSSDGRTFSVRTLQDGTGDAEVAIIHVEGVITDGGSDPKGTSVGGDDLVAAIERVREDDYDGIILQVDTPGGAVLASAEVAEAIAEVRREDNIKVVSWMRSTAASGGYYVSANADRIVAAPSTITGSIGVILQSVNVEGLADKLGIQPVTIKSGRNKDILSPYKELTPEQRDILQALIDEAYDDFVDVVAEGRDIDEDDVRELADGRIYTGRQAQENGLVDELGTREKAYEVMGELLDEDSDELRIDDYERSYDFFDVLLASGSVDGDALGAGAVLQLLSRAMGEGTAVVPPAADSGVADGMVEVQYRAVIG